MSDNIIKPLGTQFVQILCTNPQCKKEFTVELDDNRECIAYCQHCGKKYFVRITSSGELWIRTLHDFVDSKLKQELNNI